jgi:hypothetical protein
MHCLLHFLLRERHWAHQCVFVSVFVCTPVYISGGIFCVSSIGRALALQVAAVVLRVVVAPRSRVITSCQPGATACTQSAASSAWLLLCWGRGLLYATWWQCVVEGHPRTWSNLLLTG